MTNTLLVVFIILCILAAATELLAYVKQQVAWKKLGGNAVDVSAIYVYSGILKNKNTFTASLRLFEDKIILKVPSLNPFAVLKGTFPMITLSTINNTEIKNVPLSSERYLEIHLVQSPTYYWIVADDATLNNLNGYLRSHNIAQNS